MSSFDLTELNRRLANIVTIGTIDSVDYGAATARVRIGDLVTAGMPMRTMRAGGDQTWAPHEVGEQVIVLAPSGNLSCGVIIGALYSDHGAANGDRAGLQRASFANGAVIEYDRDANQFTMNLGGGSIVIKGAVTITGDVTVSGDVEAGGISLTSHRHGGVQSGGSTTGGPQ